MTSTSSEQGSTGSRCVKRGSHDQSAATSEADIISVAAEEQEAALRHFHLEDGPPLNLNTSLDSVPHKKSLKRSANSPPPDPTQDSKASLHTAPSNHDPYQQNVQAAQFAVHQANQQYLPTQASFSSQSSAGLHDGSYPPSAAFSVGASSMTSMTALEDPASTMSPPESLHNGHNAPYFMTSNPNKPSSYSQPSPQQPLPDHKSATALARKAQAANTSSPKTQDTPNLPAKYFSCECCPKKPKKFETMEELRYVQNINFYESQLKHLFSQHQSEKQYSCHFCHNRFKNKNEAERHQNSLHLRRQSWSCSNLEDVTAAFYPENAIHPNATPHNPPPPMPTVAVNDICGYCGEKFANQPHQDWGKRHAHVHTEHKFTECNQSKKFFRADHFRQHLKHSHGGIPGKHTNHLEQRCSRQEPPPEPLESASASPNQQQQELQQQQDLQQQQLQQQQLQQQAQAMQQQQFPMGQQIQLQHAQMHQAQMQQVQMHQAQMQGAPIANMGIPMRGMPYPGGVDKIDEEI